MLGLSLGSGTSVWLGTIHMNESLQDCPDTGQEGAEDWLYTQACFSPVVPS